MIISTVDLDKNKNNVELDNYYKQELSRDVSSLVNKVISNVSDNHTPTVKKNRKIKKYTNYNTKRSIKLYKKQKKRHKIENTKKAFVRLYDSTYFIREIFYDISKFIKKLGGKERSILIFYDNKEKAINLPINNFMIIFFILIISALIYTGYDAFEKQKSAREFYNTLSAREARTYTLIEDYKGALKRYSKALAEYNNMIKNMSHDIDYDNSTIPLLKNNSEDIDINKTLLEIESYQKDILSFLSVSSKIHNEIPLGWPVSGGGRISSGYGARPSPFNQSKSYHYGVDIAGPYGSKILAVGDGVVTYAGWRGGYGWFVLINHKNGYQTAYGHNSKILVSFGQKVKKGQTIALIGNTGRTTGIHCHFEVRVGGDHKNPMPYLGARF